MAFLECEVHRKARLKLIFADTRMLSFAFNFNVQSLSVFVSLNKPTHSFGEITTAFVWWNRQRIPYKPERLANCKKRDLERLTDLLILIKSYCALTTSAFHAVFTTWTERNKQSNFYSASVSQVYANGASIMERLKSNRGGYMDGRSISFTILEFLLQRVAAIHGS